METEITLRAATRVCISDKDECEVRWDYRDEDGQELHIWDADVAEEMGQALIEAAYRSRANARSKEKDSG